MTGTIRYRGIWLKNSSVSLKRSCQFTFFGTNLMVPRFQVVDWDTARTAWQHVVTNSAMFGVSLVFAAVRRKKSNYGKLSTVAGWDARTNRKQMLSLTLSLSLWLR